MERLITFLEDDSAVGNVPELIEQAKDLGVDASFVERVGEVYEQVAPKLEARNNLRNAVEMVFQDEIEFYLDEVKNMSESKEYGNFGQQEIQAAEQMLKMMDFERELYRDEFLPSEPRLNPELIQY